ncbi:U-box domain-containing protein 33-like isoform X2 [Oryza brachyantha]|uniref:U-box domain-containing protein 33-like isoform X2 n=1 Tax=Oryza brachyantha TaxID=4533 RepID=UPI0007766697|nr:U-box domain-containing protein 33-like isoform X2 [Oryza brachyantha]
MAAAPAPEEKVFVALPAEPKAGRSTLSWALGHFRDTGGGTVVVVVTHVHVPPEMIPVMGVKFHASKLNPEQVSLFRMAEREKVNELLDHYVNQCVRMKMKCEKLVIENENVVAGLLELIALHGITKLVISAAPDRNYSRKMDKPTSRTATEIMQWASPSCKIWFVCKERLICTSKDVETAPVHTPSIPDTGHDVLQLSLHQEQDDNNELELGFYDEIKEACKAAENLMSRALAESSRRQKADEELVSSLQKAKEYEELYLEEVKKRKELEGALARASREVALLKQARDLVKNHQNTIMEEPKEETAENLILQQRMVDMKAGDLGSSGQAILQEYLDHDISVVRELEALVRQRKLASSSSPSSVIQSPFDEECCIPSYFICPILQEAMREPCIAADGFTYETDAIRGWLDGGQSVSPVTGQQLAHHELIPNLSLRSVIHDHARRQRFSFS